MREQWLVTLQTLLPNKLNNMTDINNLSNEELEKANNESRAQQRIKELSDKVELTSRERDEKDKLLVELQEKNTKLERDNAFSNEFSDILGKHPAAKDHKDAIKEKVQAGYSVEDATFAVLGKAGQLGTSNGVQREAPQVAGGSATTTVRQEGNKSISEMSQAERRAILAENLTNA